MVTGATGAVLGTTVTSRTVPCPRTSRTCPVECPPGRWIKPSQARWRTGPRPMTAPVTRRPVSRGTAMLGVFLVAVSRMIRTAAQGPVDVAGDVCWMSLKSDSALFFSLQRFSFFLLTEYPLFFSLFFIFVLVTGADGLVLVSASKFHPTCDFFYYKAKYFLDQSINIPL